MSEFKKKELTDIVQSSDLDGSKVEITDWASLMMTLRTKGDYMGFLKHQDSILLFIGNLANVDEYNLLLKSTLSGEPATVQGILKIAPGDDLLYSLRVSGVKYQNESSKGYKK